MDDCCTVPPAGWDCSRTPGHDGPCAAQAQPTPRGESGAREAVAIETIGLEIADLIEQHMKSSAMIWSLGKDLPDDWMTELRSITVAALESEIPKLLSTPIPTGEVLREALEPFAAYQTSDEYLQSPVAPWAGLPIEERAKAVGERRKTRDEDILRARNALAMGDGA